MTGKTHRRFWKCFDALPPAVQKLAREKYALWKTDPYHASLKFEERRNAICVVRLGDHYRAVGVRERDVVGWFRIGTHEVCNRFRFCGTKVCPPRAVNSTKSQSSSPPRR